TSFSFIVHRSSFIVYCFCLASPPRRFLSGETPAAEDQSTMLATCWAKRRAAVVLLALLPLLMVMGCGKAKGTVKGTVVYTDAKGKETPMPGGFITFVPTESGGRGG